MNVTRKNFIKGLCAGIGLAALPTVAGAAEQKPTDVKEYYYCGKWHYYGLEFSPANSSKALSYEEVVRYTARELFRIDGLIKSGRAEGTYEHTLTIYTNGKYDRIYFIGENATIGPVSMELNDTFICKFKFDVEDVLFRLKNNLV